MEIRDILLQLCIFLCSFGKFNAVPFRLFFPFGEEEGDTVLDSGDDISSTEIQLTTPIVFYNNRYSGIFVNNNGHLSFDTDLPTFQPNLVLPIGYKVIAVFLADIDTTYAGTVYFRESTDEALLQRAALHVQFHFQDYESFMPSSLFIATWDHVGYYSLNETELNTFQIVLATDGSNSFAFFHYLDEGIHWIKSDGKLDFSDPMAQAGFDSGEGRIHTKLPYSGTERAYDFATDSNVKDDMPGVWMYHIGYVQEVVGPEVDTVTIFDPDEDTTTCVPGSKQCHVSARCKDFETGYCCECIPPTYGNGVNCITLGPQRLNGKVFGKLNDIDIRDIDMHSYVVTSDGRAYTAISRIRPELGNSMLTLNTIGGIIGWMFASIDTPSARNGYMYTGGLFNRTAVIKYQATGDEVTIKQTFFGHDAQNNIRLSTQVNGRIPNVANGVKVSLEDYKEEYHHVAPGVITAYSVRTYRLDNVAYRYTWNQTIRFTECRHDPNPVTDTMRLSVKRNFVVYDDLDEVIRYAMTNGIGVLSGSDPCRDAAQVCGENADCIPSGSTYTCQCRIGFQGGDGGSCQDIDECTDVRNICDRNARCYNVPGSFQCQCLPGFKGDGRVCTRDIQRCGEDICHERARCVYNSDLQKPMCECRSGFTGNGVDVCEPVQFSCNEVDICHEDASCVYDDDDGGYKCECNEGYSGDGVVCEQYIIDTECRCSENAQCLFDPARLIRRCQCNPGYTGDGTYCTPIAQPAVCDDCHDNAQCSLDSRTNEYYCECLPGFTGDGYRCEAASRDCRTEQICDVNADCVNDPFVGGYRCLCRNFFTGDGLRCEPDQCTSDSDCDANARCGVDPRDNTRYACRCLSGYEGDGRTCRQRVIPCNQVDNCSPDAECVYYPTELSYRCRCKPGYEGDGYSCRPRGYDCRRDSRICDPNANCILNVDSFICVCREGFRGDGRRCIAMDLENNYLMFSQGNTIHKVPYIEKEEDPGQRILYVPDQLVIAMDSDCEDGNFYWTDVSGGTINKAKLDGTERSTIVSDLRSPEGIAVDWLSRNLYWTDSGRGTVEVAKLDGSYRKNLFGSDLVNPRAIVVDPSTGMMYWTDWNRNSPKIESAHMNGENRKVLVDTDLGLPNGLTINTHTQQVCWGDAGTQKIECIRADGVGRRVITSDAPYPFDLAYLSDNIYWTDWNITGISNINQNGGEKGKVLNLPVGGNGRLYGITAVKATCPRAGYNPCSTDNGGCQFLCLPAPSGGRTCSCPDNVDPNECNEVA